MHRRNVILPSLPPFGLTRALDIEGLANHFHLVLEMRQPNLMASMKWLRGSYPRKIGPLTCADNGLKLLPVDMLPRAILAELRGVKRQITIN